MQDQSTSAAAAGGGDESTSAAAAGGDQVVMCDVQSGGGYVPWLGLLASHASLWPGNRDQKLLVLRAQAG